jgi:ribosomal protein L37AE/L43A
MDVALNRYREEVCRSCGRVFVRRTGRKMRQCIDCRMAKVMACSAQAHGKQGVYWEKMIRGQLRKWMSEARALGIDVSEEVGA